MTPARATAILVVVTLFWGVSFSLVKDWNLGAEACPGGPLVASLTLVALRMGLGWVILAAWQPGLFTRADRREYAYGALIGATFLIGSFFQVWGMTWTTPALSAFFTSLGSAWVPLLALAVFGLAVARLTLVGIGVALAGTAVLVGGVWHLGAGEGLTLLCSFLFAAQILLLDRFGRLVRAPYLSAGFLVGNAVFGSLAALVAVGIGPGLGPWAHWLGDMLTTPAILGDLLILVIFPTILGFHWMNTYQPLVPASRAALIYLLEPVFAGVFSVIWQHDLVTAPLLLGGGLILAGNVLVEMPGWRAARARAKGAESIP